MRQLDLFAVRITSRLLAIALATATLVHGAEDLKNPYQSILKLSPESSGHYSLNVKDGGSLTTEAIPKGITITQKGCELEESKLIEHQRYTLREGCVLRFEVSSPVPSEGLIIDARAVPAGDSMPPKPIRFVLVEPPLTTMGSVLSALSSTYGLGVLLILAGAGLGFFLWNRTHGEQSDDESRNRSDGRSEDSRGHGGPSAPLATPTAPLARVEYASKSDVDTLNQSLDNLDSSFKTLADAQTRLHSDVVTELSRFVERCQKAAEDAVARAASFALRAAEEVTNENEGIRSRLGVLETELTALQVESRRGLSNLLQAVPREALTGMGGAHQTDSDLAQKLEQAVARYLRDEQPDARSLVGCSQRVATLRSAIKQFRQVAPESATGQADSRLDPLDRDLDLIIQELAGFARQGNDKRFRLLFAVDFSAHETARQTLTEAIAAGLQREIVKLDSFDDYYAKRIGMLAAQVAAECADLADSVFDPQRANSAVQSALQSVFVVAEVEEIAPRRNESFLGTDHTMFQMIRRSSAVDRSGAVAQTVSRGLRQRDRIVRKATVTLFE